MKTATYDTAIPIAIQMIAVHDITARLMLTGKLRKGGEMQPVRIAIFCAALAIPASKAAQNIAAVGVGTATCGEYSDVYKKDPEGVDARFVGWLDGFLSGMNIAAIMKGEQTRNLGERDSRERLLHSYCDSHPLQDVGQAAVNIYRSLPLNPARAK